MPVDVLGLDLDGHSGRRGPAALAALCLELGVALPRTAATSGRIEGGSEIRYYRVPTGITWTAAALNAAGGGVDLIHRGHRHAKVWPSVHHATGLTYGRTDITRGTITALDDAGEPWFLPSPDELPDLPPDLVAALSSRQEAETGRGPITWVNSAARETPWAPSVRRAASVSWNNGASRHDTMTSAQAALVRLDSLGQAGTWLALAKLRDQFISHLGAERDGAAEWNRALQGAVKMVSSTKSRVGGSASPPKADGASAQPSDEALPDGWHRSDQGNAHRLVAQHGERIRHVATWAAWLVWDGARYAIDHGDGKITYLASDVARQLWAEGAVKDRDPVMRSKLWRWALRCESATAMTAMIRLARSVPGVAVTHDELDADDHLLNVANGVIDLSGEPRLRRHSTARLITKIAKVEHQVGATAPTWAAFLARVLPDAEVRSFVQRAVGYSLTGDVSEQVLLLVTGVGSNGKSTFLATIGRLLGDYAAVAPRDLLLATSHEQHPTSMTTLFGARFAAAIETEAGGRLAEAQIKQLTGGDMLTARRMRENFWTFRPTHKLWLGCNHLPRIQGQDHAIWRRIRVIPFNVVISDAERDPRLLGALARELPGILNWALAGHSAWRSDGLRQPAAVLAATAEYRLESDWLQRFMGACGYETGQGRVLSATFRDDLERWARMEGLAIGQRQYTEALQALGARAVKFNSQRFWDGLIRNA
jgi:putative DNA primase/helicase